MKLVLPERESVALINVVQNAKLVSSAIGAIETRRAVRAAGLDPSTADPILDALVLVDVTEPIQRAAGELDPPFLRTLDAVHLATALSLGAELQALIVYDRRLSDAAEAAGLSVRAPGPSAQAR